MARIAYEKDLNVAQREAVLYDEGPALVIAGAGSGKTRVLTYKLAHLIEEGYPAHKLMALTFTNKAADEMKQRVEELVGSGTAREMMVGTFHAIFSRFLRRYADLLGFNRQFTIFDTSDSRALIKQVIAQLELDSKIYSPATLQYIISDAKNRLTSPQSYASDPELRRYDTFKGMPEVYRIYEAYALALKQANAMDFDDLLYLFNVLLRDFPAVSQECQSMIDYLLIDEYQDTNATQYYIARQLVMNKQKIFAVGDDAQSIYSFRGADINNILEFTRNFSGARLFKLEQNYRSTKTIVNLANDLIAKNQQGIPKKLYSHRAVGSKVELVDYNDAREEAFRTANDIQHKMRQTAHASYEDFAILYRTNAQSRLFEEAFRSLEIPFRIYGGMAFYNRAEIKDLLAYLRIVVNPYDSVAFSRMAKYPRKGIGDKSLAQLEAIAQRRETSLYEAVRLVAEGEEAASNALRQRVSSLYHLLQKMQEATQELPLFEAVSTILKLSGIIEAIKKEPGVESQSRIDNIKEFLTSAQEYEEFLEDSTLPSDDVEATSELSQFLERIALITSQDEQRAEEETPRVTLMTIHAAKGLEYKNVYVTGLEAYLFPSPMSKLKNELEEERRLFYVAITRAMDHCTLSMARYRVINGVGKPQWPSPFLYDLDRSLLRIRSEKLTHELATGRRLFSSSDFGETELPIFSPPQRDGNSALSDELPQFPPRAKEYNSPHTSTSRASGSYKVGQKVSHYLFGRGEVIALSGEVEIEKAIVRFEDGEERHIILRFAKLVPLDEDTL